uniref:Structural toxin peptide sea anemone type 9a n=1 Tax=Calliactis polypus TaxID=656064 RepID=S9A_CALPY
MKTIIAIFSLAAMIVLVRPTPLENDEWTRSIINVPCKKCYKKDSNGVCRKIFGCQEKRNIIDPPCRKCYKKDSNNKCVRIAGCGNEAVKRAIINPQGCARCHKPDPNGKCRKIHGCS